MVRLTDLIIVVINLTLLANVHGIGFCSGELNGYSCCTKTVSDPEYDSNGYPYGYENGTSCIVPKDCPSCVKNDTSIKYNDKGFCIGSLYGFPCCQKVVSNPEYDANGYPYGTENNKSCIVPKQCSKCVQGFCYGRMYGFPCCTERVTNPDYDSEGNAYGKKGDESCIIPKGCTKCIINATKTETMTSLSSKWRRSLNHKKSQTSSDKKTQSASKKKSQTSSDKKTQSASEKKTKTSFTPQTSSDKKTQPASKKKTKTSFTQTSSETKKPASKKKAKAKPTAI